MKEVRFRTMSGESVTAKVKEPGKMKLGALLSRAASEVFRISGGFECVDENNEVVSPETPVSELPDGQTYTVANEFTAA